MDSVMVSILSVIFSVEFITGTLGNGFIIMVNCMDLVRRTKISASDYMLTALAISRIGLLWLLFTKWWTHVFYPSFFISVMTVRITYVIWTVTCHFNAWLATCLSIFYCLKIANFSNSVFLYFKWRAKKVVSVTLLVSLILLLLNIFQSKTHMDVWIGEYKRNMSYNFSLYEFPEFSNFLLFSNTVFTFIAFALSLTSFLLLIFSLGKHLKRMQLNARGSRDAGTTAHMKALQSVVVFLLLYTVFFLSLLTQNLRYQSFLLFCHVTTSAFPSVHSFVLVLGNIKLKRASFLLLRRLRCGSSNAESPGS
ncbi:taste receptor type 2 member 14-like [Fukomys damarensis]|uniref:taste receptor type 2 member 14-like n=1 Tax=Fukomys damarensis TaxID=885580 RepID=UPI000540075D|nr:taste receptor type 2 member 14-like [Fukomys damarensis]